MDLLEPSRARAYLRADLLKNQARLIRSCTFSVGAVTVLGLGGAMANFWPAIAMGLGLGTWVLWREWRQWNPPRSPFDSKTGQALVRWFQAQPNPMAAATAAAENERYGKGVAEVARQWIKAQSEQETPRPAG